MTINPEKITELRELDDDGSDAILKELITLYLSSTPPKLKKMLEFYYLKDLSSLQKESHSLRSSSLTVGAEDLSQIAYEIEYSKDGPGIQEFLQERIKKLNKEFEAVKEELSRYL